MPRPRLCAHPGVGLRVIRPWSPNGNGPAPRVPGLNPGGTVHALQVTPAECIPQDPGAPPAHGSGRRSRSPAVPRARWYIPPVPPAPAAASVPAGGLANATFAPDEDPLEAALLDDVAERGFQRLHIGRILELLRFNPPPGHPCRHLGTGSCDRAERTTPRTCGGSSLSRRPQDQQPEGSSPHPGFRAPEKLHSQRPPFPKVDLVALPIMFSHRCPPA